jgi:alkanesulfonate monooxygenase
VQPAIPIFWGGSSELGVRFGAELADVYAIGGGSVDRISAVIAQVRADAARHGRNPRISMSMRLVLGETDGAAWARADALVATVEAAQRARGLLGRDLGEYAERRLRNVQESDGKDGNGCLWTGLTEATQGRMQAMCLVGAPDTIVTALLDYYRVGVDNFLITGFDPLGDIALIGKSVAPQLRRLTALEPRPFAQPTVHPA